MTDHPDRLKTALADRYTIERELGRGGMATVYLAQDLKHGRPVALKVLMPELAAVLGGGRFLNEIRVTANLQHPHILPLHDSGEADAFLYYVMPYVEGESLRDKLARETQLSVDAPLTRSSSRSGSPATLPMVRTGRASTRQGVVHVPRRFSTIRMPALSCTVLASCCGAERAHPRPIHDRTANNGSMVDGLMCDTI